MTECVFDTALSCDVPYLKVMWKEIFKDSDEYIELYFSYKFKEGNTFVIRENKRIVCTLYVEYNDVFFDGRTVKGAYFCGIATDTAYRGKGYAKRLIEYAKNNIKKVDIIYLIPANESLFKFYKEAGFKTFTYLSKEEVFADGICKKEAFREEFDYPLLNYFYENSGSRLYVKRDEAFFKAIYDCYKNIMIFEDGYVIYYIEDGIVNLVEYSFEEGRAREALKGVLNYNKLKKGILYKKYGKTPFSVCITELDTEKCDKKYINLMLN